MIDALLSPPVAGIAAAVSVGAIAVSVGRINRDELSESKLPLMGVAGALVFAGQMINFTIPGTGSSGHIGGGILLAGLLGPFPALLAIAAVLIIQCLFFADGGLLALGANILNMGVIPCLIVYPLIFKPLLSKFTAKRISIAAIVSVIVGLELGAFAVVLETLSSGITELPFITFTALMLPIHLAIGVVEGIVTAAVLVFVWKARPEILESSGNAAKLKASGGVKLRNVLITLGVLVVLIGAGLSLFASSHPDGLEWAMERTAGTAELEADGAIYSGAEDIQTKTAFLPDYENTSLSGIVGAGITFVVAGGAGFIISLVKRKHNNA
jgi:cobalt/nickel transport system permease protein